MKYIPILKYKERIDMSSYEKLDINSNTEVVPLIEVFQQDKISMDKISIDKKFYCSILTERNLDFEFAVDLFIEAKNYHQNLIPVINSDYRFKSRSKKELVKCAKKLYSNFDEVALKINGINKFYLPDELENILFFVEDFSKLTVFLDIDFAFKYEQSSMIKSYTTAIDEIHKRIDEEITNFVLCGSIVSISSAGLKTFDEDDEEHNLRKNELLRVFKLFEGTYPDLNLKYSDYTIDEKNMFIDDNGGGMFFPSVKFTNPEGDICIYKSAEKNEFEKYKHIANLIMNREDYNHDHCPGCNYIEQIHLGTAGGKNTGSPSTWKVNMIVHHIKTILSILR